VTKITLLLHFDKDDFTVIRMPTVRIARLPEKPSIFTRWSPVFMIAGVVCIIAAVMVVPQLIIKLRRLPLTPKEQLDAEAAIRTAIIQLLGGLVLIAGLYFTARGFRLTREGHITDRYSKAIEQLGHDNRDVRIGGIYALERIMHDSQPDRETIVDVLATFVREHTRVGHNEPSKDPIGADVQSAISVLGRRPGIEEETKKLDLYHSGLNHADMAGQDLRGVMLYYSSLDNTTFAGANLTKASLSFCSGKDVAFTNCSAIGANFVNAAYIDSWFLHANLTRTDFYGCDLSHSDFGRRYIELGQPPFPPATLTEARFTKAKLTGTILRGVDLSTVRGLTKDQLAEAIIDANTIPPEKWGTSDDEE